MAGAKSANCGKDILESGKDKFYGQTCYFPLLLHYAPSVKLGDWNAMALLFSIIVQFDTGV